MFCKLFEFSCVFRAARLTWCGVHGLFGFIFNDFGPAFVVNDTTGENPRTAIIRFRPAVVVVLSIFNFL